MVRPPSTPQSDPDASLDVSPVEPTTKPRKAEPWGWTRPHRIALGVLLAALLGFLLTQYLRRPHQLDDPIVTQEGRVLELEQTVDPNTADYASLARVPHMTPELARAIIAYRDERRIKPGEVVFESLDDLGMVKRGKSRISKKTLEAIGPFLRFPEAGTQPAASEP